MILLESWKDSAPKQFLCIVKNQEEANNSPSYCFAAIKQNIS